jgi:hypothetical protein
MTIQPLFQRLIRKWKVRDVANMPADVMLQLLVACNASIQEFYRLCPAIYREGWVSGVLAAPVAQTLTVTQGSQAFTGYSAPAAQFGATVVIGPDKNDNLIVPPSGLIDTYQGVSGAQPSTIYGDAIPLPANIETMLDEPQLLGYLPRLRREDLYWGRPWNPSLFYSESLIATPYRQVARPRTYWVEANVPDLNGVPTFIFRVDPMPDVLYRVRFRALFYPQRLSMSDFSNNTTLTVNEAWIESLLLPLIFERMSRDPDLWQGADAKTIALDAAAARVGIENLRVNISKPNNRIETPAGF